MMYEVAHRFLANAEEFRERASRASTEVTKQKMLMIAQDWMRLAEWMRPENGQATDVVEKPNSPILSA